MKVRLDRDWIQTVYSHLHAPARDTRLTVVREYLGRSVEASDGVSDSGLAFAFKLKDRYRQGYGLGLPARDGWMLGPEYMLNQDLHLGGFDDSLVLAMIAARDPSGVLSLSAAARMSPRATTRDLVAEMLMGVGAETAHDRVREVIDYAGRQSFSAQSVEEVRQVITQSVQDIRHDCFVELKQSLTDLLNATLDPALFLERFFDLSERTLIKVDIYASMVGTLIRSSKIRPMVKLLLIENIWRMPKRVRYEVVSAIKEVSNEPGNAYLKRELLFVLERKEDFIPAAPAPQPKPTEMRHLFH